MDFLAILLSIAAVIMAFIALQRTGGLKDFRQQMDLMTSKTEEATKGARETTADALRRLEHMIRGQGIQPSDTSGKERTQPSDPEGKSSGPSEPGSLP
jgi:hypothetical protein